MLMSDLKYVMWSLCSLRHSSCVAAQHSSAALATMSGTCNRGGKGGRRLEGAANERKGGGPLKEGEAKRERGRGRRNHWRGRGRWRGTGSWSTGASWGYGTRVEGAEGKREKEWAIEGQETKRGSWNRRD